VLQVTFSENTALRKCVIIKIEAGGRQHRAIPCENRKRQGAELKTAPFQVCVLIRSNKGQQREDVVRKVSTFPQLMMTLHLCLRSCELEMRGVK